MKWLLSILPLIGSWNTGQYQRAPLEDRGFDPTWQVSRIKQGDPYLISFEMFEKYRTPGTRDARAIHYAEAWEYAKQHKLPVSFVGENWEDRFRLDGWDDSVFISPSIKIPSPWSDNIDDWKKLGTVLGEYMHREFAVDYPDCPRVHLLNNCEIGFPRRGEELLDPACPEFVKSLDLQGRQEYMFRGYRIRRAALVKALNEACPLWAGRIHCFAYGGFGNEFGASEARNNSNQRLYFEPWGLRTSGYNVAANAGYVHGWQTWEVGTVRSPVVEACNVKYAFDKYREVWNPDFQMETLYWNGKKDPPDVWKGCCRMVMWTTRTPVHRLFTGSGETREDTLERDMQPLLEVAAEARDYEDFWDHGTLLTNRWTRDFDEMPAASKWDTATGYGHPYHWDYSMWPEWNDPGDRWFLQHVPINERIHSGRDWWQSDRQHSAVVKVWAICIEYNGERIIVACAPNGAQDNVLIEVNGTEYVIPHIPVEGCIERV